MTDLDLTNPVHLRAEMARRGLPFDQLLPYEDPEHGYVDPLDDPETRIAVRVFMGRLWQAALRAEEDSELEQLRAENELLRRSRNELNAALLELKGL